MLKGEELGRAIESALKMSGMSQRDLAAHFGVKPPSVTGWIKTGRVSKDKLPKLFVIFQPWVGPEHWGLTETEYSLMGAAGPVSRSGSVSSAQSHLMEMLSSGFASGALSDRDAEAIEAFVAGRMSAGRETVVHKSLKKKLNNKE